MKKLIILALTGLSLAACSQPTLSSSPATTSEMTTSIDWNQAGPDAKANQISFTDVEQAVQNGAKFYDVRSPEEFAAGNFGITENLPLAELKAGHFPDISKDTPIYVHCEQGNWSAQATKLLREAGFTAVYDLGGLRHVEAIGGVLE